MKFFLSLNIFVWLFSISFSQECKTAFDFTEWSMEGSPNASWDVTSPDNVINSSDYFPPTFFVNRKKLINVLIKGTVSVETGFDDDFIGFVFGYKKPTQLADDNTYHFYLLDWKKKTGSVNGYEAKEGFRLSYYNGFITLAEQKQYFWGRVEHSPQRRLLAEKYSDTLGWKSNQKYLLELLYTSNRISISIDGKIIFERSGCFDSGKFGFYCMSQSLVRFEDFTYESHIGFVPSPQSVCLGKKIYFNAFDLNCSAFPDFIESMNWDFGDGHTSTAINPDHIYTEAGEYQVELIVDKVGDCADTIVKTVTIKPLPIVNLGNDTLIPACSSITLDAGNPGDKYVWSTGQASQSIELTELYTDTTIWVNVNKNGCLSGDTIFIEVKNNKVKKQLYFPNAFTPNGDGKNDAFTALGPTDDVSLYQLIIRNRWGQQIFETNDPNLGWDGGEPLCPGVYVYQVAYRIEGNCIETMDFSRSGSVVLLK